VISQFTNQSTFIYLLNRAELHCAGIDADAARSREQTVMMRDASQWLENGECSETPHSKTGATALHVAAAKGYTDIIRSVQVCRPFVLGYP